ncbi:MAG: DUF2490 domain-containing protein [Spirosomataceae bacterium]
MVGSVAAQPKEVEKQVLYWTRYYNQWTLSPKWSWHNEVDNRRFLKPNKQHHLIFHSHVHYRLLQNVDFALGFTYSRQSPQLPDATAELIVPELRPFQEVNVSTTLAKRFSLTQRFRLDERFIHKNNGKALLDGYDFNWRFRYRLQASLLVSKQAGPYQTNLKLADELMVNAGRTIGFNQFDQNRIYAGVEQSFGKNIALELGYLHWYQQRSLGYQFFSRDIIRFTLHHRIKLKGL